MISLFTGLLFSLVCSAAFGQTELERISVSERSDGLGYVLRYHLSQPVDSIQTSRRDMKTLQMVLYSSDISTEDYLYLGVNDLIRRVQFHDLPFGLGVEVSMRENRYYLTSAYPDQNGRDILLAFERKSADEVAGIVEAPDQRDLFKPGEPPVGEEAVTDISAESETEDDRPEETDDSFEADEGLEHTASGFTDRVRRQLFEREYRTPELQTLMPGDPMEFYVRSVYAGHSGGKGSSYLLRPTSMEAITGEWQQSRRHPWADHPFFRSQGQDELSAPVRFYSQEIFLSHNNKRPDGFNDGALWQGRGINMAFTTGVSLQYGPFRAVLRPVFIHSENRDFELSDDPQFPGISSYGMALTNADIPQRFGESAINTFDPGDSYVEFEYSGFAAGFSNQRLWTGPAVHNPLMLSSNAPGFKHVYAGTSRPVSVPGGRLEGRMFWGSLKESDYFDEDPGNDRRFITGLELSYSPDFVPGLHVGYSRVGYSYYGSGVSISDLLMPFQLSPPKPDPEEADSEEVEFLKGSFFARWAYPQIGFEVYTEWGRNDDKRRIRDFVSEPELNRGYVLGVIQRISAGRYGSVVLNGEVTNLENSSVTAQYRDTNIWYTNEIIRQGFTHKGQVLGAGIGPGSSTQVVTASFYHKYGMIGFSLARIAMHNDRLFTNREYYHSTLPRDWMTISRIHEVEIRHGLHGLLFLPGNMELQMDLYTGNIENRHNDYDRPRPGGRDDDIFFDERNVHLSFTLRYNFSGLLR